MKALQVLMKIKISVVGFAPRADRHRPAMSALPFSLHDLLPMTGKSRLFTLPRLLVLAIVAAALFLVWPLYQRSIPQPENEKPVDAVLIGGGIMSMTLATYLQALQPDWQLQVFERRGAVAEESSEGWNNAGTGHAGFAELNYTPQKPDGTIETTRAINIAEQFEISRQFWASMARDGRLSNPRDYINPTAHMSFVWGEDRAEFLRKRHELLTKNPLFHGMQYSTDPEQIRKWAPLMMEGRDPSQKVAATWMPLGTDVNFGVITRKLAEALQKAPNFKLGLNHEVTALRQNADKTWDVAVKDLQSGKERTVRTRFVFVGAGGATLKLLQLSGIPEARRYAGFPVGGEFLAFQNPALTARHTVKAYGMADTGAPPMSVPHLDARKLDGQPVMLFGPYALYSTKFLKYGSWWDLFSSVTQYNVLDMLTVGANNLDLVKYLVQQAMLTDEDRHKELLRYFPSARREDWKLVTGGQRVQVIKHDPEKGAILQFGTEIVSNQDRTLTALMGASPGASTSPPIMLKILEQSFPQQMKDGWSERLKQIIPSYGQKLNDSAELTNRIRKMTSDALQLPYVEVPLTLGKAATPALNAPASTTGQPAANGAKLPAPAASQTGGKAAAERNANREMQAP